MEKRQSIEQKVIRPCICDKVQKMHEYLHSQLFTRLSSSPSFSLD